MPVSSFWVSVDDRKTVKESGYNEMPDMVSVFDKDAREDYGRSPMMKKLPDIRMVNHTAKAYIKGTEKMVDPVMLTPDDGSVWPLATQPGGVVHYRAGGDKPDWLKFEGNLAHMEKFIERVQLQIKAGFFLDMARVEQKIRFLTPIIGRLQSGLFNPMIDRIIGILGRLNLLPEQPEALIGQDYGVMYLGRLALAMKTMETEGLAKTIVEMSPLEAAGIETGWQDNVEWDEATRGSMRNNGVPASWIKTVKERDLQRLADQQAAQIQQMLEAAPELAKAYKLGSGVAEEGSLSEGALKLAG
jgi:hypothetical protein